MLKNDFKNINFKLIFDTWIFDHKQNELFCDSEYIKYIK